MAQPVQNDRYPEFVADQVLTATSLNQMFGYLEEQQRLTRTTLIGIGVLCGMKVRVSNDGTSLTITSGVGVTSKGYLVVFPETKYIFYDDEFSAEQELIYEPFIDAGTGKQKFPLYLLHSNGAAEIKKPINTSFLEDKAVVIFVELLQIDNKNCDPDSCDDKGRTIEVTPRPLLVDLENLDELIFKGLEGIPYHLRPTCIEWPEIRMPRYNVPATLALNSPEVLKNFLKVLSGDFILKVENLLVAAYNSVGFYVRDDFPVNPFSGLRNRFKFLYDGTISAEQLLFIQYYYDFFSDLILTYDELRRHCNRCLSLCSPNQELFPRHLILGNAIPDPDEFRHHWIQSPAFSCDCCSIDRIGFLLKKIALLIQKLNIPKSNIQDKRDRGIRITPSNYGNLPLSEKAIPYYYDIVNSPDELYKSWNFDLTQLRKGDTNLSYAAWQYNNDDHIKDPLSYDIEGYNFFRIEGHLGMNWKNALTEISNIRKQKRLPIDVVALNGDIFELIRSILSNRNSLADILAQKPAVFSQIRCHFADIESHYDTHRADLKCRLTKVMDYFYSQKSIEGEGNLEATANIPLSRLVRSALPNYRTFDNSLGQDFDRLYIGIMDQPYIRPEGMISAPAIKKNLVSNPVYLMYYLEKIDDLLVDGLVQLQIAELNERLNDASRVATQMLAGADQTDDFKMPVLWEESLDSIVRLCKTNIFEILYRNLLINLVLYISNQSFAVYSYKNPGVQHKAGVTSGGTFILVYNDKNDSVFTNLRALIRGVGTEEEAAGPEVNQPSMEAVFAEGVKTGTKICNELQPGGIKIGRNPILNYREHESVKGIGLTDILDLVERRPGEGFTDQDLAELVNQFPDGTVIADFFIPDMCCSSCVPMNFIVLEDKEPPPGEIKILLDIKPREFCENDDQDYTIRAAPEGGQLKIDGQPSDRVFNPTSVELGDNLSKELVITYEVSGDVKNIRIKVYHKPEVSISIKSLDPATGGVEFNNDTRFAETYLWNFGNGLSSDQKDPGVVKFEPGQPSTITLKAFNGPCTSESGPLVINFGQPPGEHVCTGIGDLGEKFTRVHQTSSEEFKGAIPDYQVLMLVLLEKFPDIAALKQEEQCRLLPEDLSLSVIQRTIKVLAPMINAEDSPRGPALLLYEVIFKLVLFYACCQDRDVNEARTKTDNTLKIMLGHISAWGGAQINFKVQEKAILKTMLESVIHELEIATAFTPGKVVYIDMLKQLAEALNRLLQ